MAIERMDRFDRVFWRHWWSLAKPYWMSDQRRQGLGLLAVLIALTSFSIAVNAELSYVWRDITNSLTARHYAIFRNNILFVIGVFVILIPTSAFYPWVSSRLVILWRRWMTHNFLSLEFSDLAYYRLTQTGTVDNPDQRVSEDIRDFVAGTLSYVDTFATSIVYGIVFFCILWSISPSLAVFAVGYSALGTVISLRVGRPLIHTNFDQQRYEADFRFALVHVRDNAEAIALSRGETNELSVLSDRFERLFQNFNLLILWKRRLAYVTAGYNDLITLLPYLVLAGPYFAHKIELGQLLQAVGAFATLKASLSIVVDFLQSFTNYAAVVNRLATFREQCFLATPEPPSDCTIEIVEADDLKVDSITLSTPDERETLVEQLSFEVPAGGRLLLKGPSGSGKTSILRAIAGLWNSGRGRIERPAEAGLRFLPENPYFVLGSLRDQLRYPRTAKVTEQELQSALAAVNLENLPDRAGGFDVEQSWADILSRGEQQRLCFARILMDSPRWVLLDEATSALDPLNEEVLYELLIARGIAFVTIGHDDRVAKYHNIVIQLEGNGRWSSPRVVPSYQTA